MSLRIKYLVITVENFYWILFDTLLKPCNLGCRYFYPFGTTENLSCYEFEPERIKNYLAAHDHFALHFDQEPIYKDSDLCIFNASNGNYFKTARLLANSEHSAWKKRLCNEYGLADWYYFYHGFAALHWYQDTRYIDTNKRFSKSFLSLNHLIRHKRSYRMALTARLVERGVVDAGLVSFFGDRQTCLDEINDSDTQLSEYSQKLIQSNLHDVPRFTDSFKVSSEYSARMGFSEYSMRQDAFLHVVNETVFYEPKLHLTEKIFQPIVCMRPFVLVASPGTLSYLKSYGFRTFGNWIDESYDSITDPDQRLDAITDIITAVANLPRDQLEHMHKDMQEVLIFNKQHFFGGFQNKIVHELVDNFDTCLRMWFNGRFDTRGVKLHPNLSHAKLRLLQ